MEGDVLQQDDREPVGFDWSRLASVKPVEFGLRFVFGTVIALVAAIAGTAAGPRFGGCFSPSPPSCPRP